MFSIALVILGKLFSFSRTIIRSFFRREVGEIPVLSASPYPEAPYVQPSIFIRTISFAIPMFFIALIGGNTLLLVLNLSNDEDKITVFSALEVALAKADSITKQEIDVALPIPIDTFESTSLAASDAVERPMSLSILASPVPTREGSW